MYSKETTEFVALSLVSKTSLRQARDLTVVLLPVGAEFLLFQFHLPLPR